jgi:ketosteroid isomerase-like protein
VMRGWADDGVMVLGGRTALSGRYEGKAAIRECFARIFAGLDGSELMVQHVGFANPVALTLANTMFVAYHVRERSHDGQAFETDAIAVFQLRRGKAVHLTEYWLDPAGGEAIWGRRVDEPGVAAPPSREENKRRATRKLAE